MQGGGGRAQQAFTMAEILLSLTIIGVVAAITLPSLTGNINERTWNTQRKALYARMSQALPLMDALNGYGTFKAESSSGAGDAVDTAAETFVTAGLSKVLKINNVCDSQHLADCGISSNFTDLDGNKVESFPDNLVGYNSALNDANVEDETHSYPVSTTTTKAIGFETVNGESILLYYNPHCMPKEIMDRGGYYFAQNKVCANFVYDLNGSKGPNTMGKDIGFITVLHPSDSIVVAPIPLPRNSVKSKSQINAGDACKELGDDSRVPNVYELSAIFFNRLLIGSMDGFYWSSTLETYNNRVSAYLISLKVGYASLLHNRESINGVWCIKR